MRRNVARHVSDGGSSRAPDGRVNPGPPWPGRNRPVVVRISVPSVLVNPIDPNYLAVAGIERQGESPECTCGTVFTPGPVGRAEGRLRARAGGRFWGKL